MESAHYLDALKRRYKLRSDYAAAQFLGRNDQTVRNWRRGRSMDDETALEVAALLDVPAGRVLADMAAMRAQCEAVRAAWKDAALRLGAVNLTAPAEPEKGED